MQQVLQLLHESLSHKKKYNTYNNYYTHCGKHNVLTCGEARYSLARLETSLINVARNSGEIASRSGLTGVWYTESLHTPLPHLPTQIADQVTKMGGLLHYWTCVVIVGCSYCMYKATMKCLNKGYIRNHQRHPFFSAPDLACN